MLGLRERAIEVDIDVDIGPRAIEDKLTNLKPAEDIDLLEFAPPPNSRPPSPVLEDADDLARRIFLDPVEEESIYEADNREAILPPPTR